MREKHSIYVTITKFCVRSVEKIQSGRINVTALWSAVISVDKI